MQPTVVLVVGEKGVRMACHKFPSTLHSAFFEKAFNGSFVEEQVNEISLQGDSEEHMQTFVS